jgi:hypothetical protein
MKKIIEMKLNFLGTFLVVEAEFQQKIEAGEKDEAKDGVQEGSLYELLDIKRLQFGGTEIVNKGAIEHVQSDYFWRKRFESEACRQMNA